MWKIIKMYIFTCTSCYSYEQSTIWKRLTECKNVNNEIMVNDFQISWRLFPILYSLLTSLKRSFQLIANRIAHVYHGIISICIYSKYFEALDIYIYHFRYSDRKEIFYLPKFFVISEGKRIKLLQDIVDFDFTVPRTSM